jgi:4-amino-4-deoxy-L-arabinose transferase-like glycosyltransferase
LAAPSIAPPDSEWGSLGRGGAGGIRGAAPAIPASAAAAPAWSRPLLCLLALLSGALTLWGLTRNGFANSYYAEAAQAASRSWTALLTNSLDLSGSESLDKGPLPNMLMGLSGRVLGFSSFSMLLPDALCGVCSVLVLHDLTRRTLGHAAAILAALMLALTPVFIAMSRFNNPDALLVLLEVSAAWALVRALQTDRTRHMLLCGLFVGLAFNVKMLEAYLIVPALALAFVVAGRGTLRRRSAQLLAAGGAMVAVSFAWYGAMTLVPAARRPWVGDTTNNSWFSLIFGANGVGRVSGASGSGTLNLGGATGPLRLFNSALGGQIAWLLPLALAGLALGLWTRRRAPRGDLGRAAHLLWGIWAVTLWAVFSFSAGIFHPYYTVLLAPAVAVLAAGVVVELWNRSSSSPAWRVSSAVAIVGTASLGAMLIGRAPAFLPWLGPLAICLGAVSVPAHRRAARLAGAAALAAVLAGPASFTLATLGRSSNGSNPLGGPTAITSASAPSRPAGSRTNRTALTPAGGVAVTASAGVMGGAVSIATIRYLEAHQGGTRYLVAAVGSTTAGAIALTSARNVIDIGGFAGSDPAPSLAQLRRFVAAGELHYVLISTRQRLAVGAFSGAASARDRWIEQHGTIVDIAGQSGLGATLYRL